MDKIDTYLYTQSQTYRRGTAIPTTLKIYWDDGDTIECRYFPSQRKAKAYAVYNGIQNYKLEPTK